MDSDFCVVIDDEHDIPTEIKLVCSSGDAGSRFAEKFNGDIVLNKGTWKAQSDGDGVVYVSRFPNPRKEDMSDYVKNILSSIGIEVRI